MKKYLILTILCLCLLLGSCVKTEPDFVDTTVHFTDATGETVSLPQNPAKVAVLFSSFADIWLTAGGEIAVTVGESVERGFADANTILVDDAAGKRIDTETLIASAPDLVIGSADIEAQCDAADVCRSAGIPTVLLRVESFDDYLTVLKLFTTLTGNDDRYATYGTELSTDIRAQIADYTAGAKETSVLFIRAGSGARYTKAKTVEDHFAAAMLEELGCRNIADAAPVLLDGLSFEEILAKDPDHIFISTMGDEDAAKAYMDDLLKEPTWQSLTAVKEGNVHYLPKSLFQYKPNARWGEAYTYLITILEGNTP
ncbi:MAG: ABC transporter substrate-binding protein [Clostridia bacterium]|nr:ABC transporter substrate-binding protein [Clostridia bacterium]